MQIALVLSATFIVVALWGVLGKASTLNKPAGLIVTALPILIVSYGYVSDSAINFGWAIACTLAAYVGLVIAALLGSRPTRESRVPSDAAATISRICGIAVTLGIGAIGVALFGVPFRGSPLLLLPLSFLFLCGSLGMGLFISAVSRSQVLATQIALVATFLPAFLLSGFMFAIENMPPVLRAISYLVPARYFLVVTRGIFLKGVGISVLRYQALLMLGFAVVGLALAVRSFRKELD